MTVSCCLLICVKLKKDRHINQVSRTASELDDGRYNRMTRVGLGRFHWWLSTLAFYWTVVGLSTRGCKAHPDLTPCKISRVSISPPSTPTTIASNTTLLTFQFSGDHLQRHTSSSPKAQTTSFPISESPSFSVMTENFTASPNSNYSATPVVTPTTTESSTTNENSNASLPEAPPIISARNETTDASSCKQLWQKENSYCSCYFYSQNTSRVRVLQSWTYSNSSTTERPDDESLRWSFTEPCILISAGKNLTDLYYGVIVSVTGSYDDFQCTDTEPRPAVGVKAGLEELVFEAPLIIIGAALLVLALILLMVGGTLIRKYRRKVKHVKSSYVEMKEISKAEPKDNYEEVINEPHGKESGSCSSSSDHDETDRPRLSLASQRSKDERHLKPQPYQSEDKKTTTKLKENDVQKKRYNFHLPGWKKKKKIQISQIENGPKNEDTNVGEDVYAVASEDIYTVPDDTVQPDYEQQSLLPTHSSSTVESSRVKTPLVLDPNTRATHSFYQKAKHTVEAQAMARSKPRIDTPGEGNNDYSRLERGLKSLSSLVSEQADYEKSNQAVYSLGNTTLQRKSVDIIDLAPRHQQQLHVETQNSHTGIQEQVEINNETENDQDHIYEYVEKEEDAKAAKAGTPCTKLALHQKLETEVDQLKPQEEINNQESQRDLPQVTMSDPSALTVDFLIVSKKTENQGDPKTPKPFILNDADEDWRIPAKEPTDAGGHSPSDQSSASSIGFNLDSDRQTHSDLSVQRPTQDQSHTTKDCQNSTNGVSPDAASDIYLFTRSSAV